MTKNAGMSVCGWTAAMLAGLIWADSSGAGEALVRTYQPPYGEMVSSIAIQWDGQLPRHSELHHVILIDTSASQVGEHRQMAVGVLKNFLDAIPESDRASVFAYDVNTVPLTKGFRSPADASQEALISFSKRFPAGASNLHEALQTALDQIPQGEKGSVLIIGDGMSAARLLQPAEVESMMTAYRAQGVSVHSFATGSTTDLQLLGTFAQETGGYLIQDQWDIQVDQARDVALQLAEAARQSVVYPESISLSSSDVKLVNARVLPLRTDRETVYLARGPVTTGLKVEVQGADQNASWTVEDVSRAQGNTFLTVIEQATVSTGLAASVAGEAMLTNAQQAFEDHVAQLETQGRQAVIDGDAESLTEIVTYIENVDPNNGWAAHQKSGSALLLVQGEQRPFPTQDSLQAPADSGSSSPLQIREQPVTGSKISGYESLVAARGQRLSRDVANHIEEANELLHNRLPSQAEDTINRARGAVKSATDVDAELKDQLLRQLNAALQDIRKKRLDIDTINQERQRLLAEREAQARLIDFATERDRQLEQMTDRIRALMTDAYHGDPEAFEDAEAVAREVSNEFPGTATASAVVFVTEAAGQLSKADRLRSLRSDRFLETLYMVELSHVPFPDEPPVRYPPSEVWWALTEMREKWKSVDLRNDSENERKIYNALEQITSFDFIDNPLETVIETLSELHGIPIVIDEKALDESGVNAQDQTVKLTLSGVRLKSGLKMMLENVGDVPLTYIIEDEVMKITTQDKADEILQTRVYPVGDLVITSQTLLQSVGGGMGGGMMGGMGGGMMGGMGGGMMGGGMGGGMMGGGMGGGMGGMGGMGMFSIPAESPEAVLGTSTQTLKKKPNLR